jgi:hypothetical protein
MLHRFAQALHVRPAELLPDPTVANEVEQLTDNIRRSLRKSSTGGLEISEQNLELIARVLWTAQSNAADGSPP